MTPREPSTGAVDVLRIEARGGAIGLVASDVAAILEADAPEEELPSLDLSSLIGPGRESVAPRRIRVAAAGAPRFDLVTAGALSVVRVPAEALHPVPAWLSPLVAELGAAELILEPSSVTLVADPAKLLAMCAAPRGAGGAGAGAAAPPPGNAAKGGARGE
jgi:hypothetical protein